MRLLNLNMIAQSCYQILLIVSKWRLSFEKISKIFQMWVSAQDVHSTDQRAQVLKVVMAELIKAKFQSQTIKINDLYVCLCVRVCLQLMKLTGHKILAGSHWKALQCELVRLSLKPTESWLEKGRCKGFCSKWCYTPSPSLHSCAYWKCDKRKPQPSEIFLRQLRKVSEHVRILQGPKFYWKRAEPLHFHFQHFQLRKRQKANIFGSVEG